MKTQMICSDSLNKSFKQLREDVSACLSKSSWEVSIITISDFLISLYKQAHTKGAKRQATETLNLVLDHTIRANSHSEDKNSSR